MPFSAVAWKCWAVMRRPCGRWSRASRPWSGWRPIIRGSRGTRGTRRSPWAISRWPSGPWGGRPRRGRPLDRARAIYERQPPEQHTLYNLACACSILAALAEGDEGRAYADRAMAALRRAVNIGSRDIPMLRSDRDLDSLRSRPDFQMLLLDVAFPNDPFARSD